METKIIGNKIALARKRINISQAQLSQRLFISPQAVGKWERGESMPDIITLNRLAEILGVDLNYFSDSQQSTVTGNAPIESLAEPSAELPSGVQRLTDKARRKLSWDMSRGNWVDADFSGLKNLHSKFSASNMQRCLFVGSDLSELLLKGNHMVGCDFSNSNFRGSHIQASYLMNNLFKDCSLMETEFSESYISGCDFSGADFTGVVVKSGGIEKSTLARALWNRTSFITSGISDIVFDGTIDDCYFENCSFKKVIFQHATLTNTFFKNKHLKGVQFVECQADQMTYEFLKNGKADMSGITLLRS